MKIKISLLFLMVAGMAYAQKREMRKIEKAVEKQDFAKAQSIFKEIDPAEVEEKYEGAYQLYKAATIMDLTGKKQANLSELRQAEQALALAEEKDYDEQYIKIVNTFINARKFALANESLSSGEVQTAYELVSELYESNPDNMEMLYNAANLAYSVKEYEDALSKFQTLLDEDYTGVTTTYLATNKDNGEVELFPSKKLRDIAVSTGSHSNPKDEKSASNLGDLMIKTVWLYKNNGDIEKAKTLFMDTLDKYPNDQSLMVVKPDVYLTLEMMEEYQKANDERSNGVKDPKVYDNLALAAFKKQNYDKAIEYFQLSLAMEPKNYAALVNVSNAYLEKGNLESTTAKEQRVLYKSAITHLEKALELQPEDKGVIQTLISLYGVFNMEDRAAELKAKL